MKNKKNIKRICFSLFIIVLISALTYLVIYTSKNSCKKIAFYNIPKEHKNTFTKYIEKSLNESFSIIELDSSIPLSLQEDQLKKVSLLFCITDSNTKQFATSNKNVFPISQNYTTEMPISIKSSIPEKSNNLAYIPFLYDMYQIDVNYDMYKQTSKPNINTWNDFINVASEEIIYSPSPIIIPFYEDKEFLNIFGQLFEVFSNYQKYEELHNALSEAYQKDMANNYTSTYCIDFMKSLLESNYEIINTYNQLKKMFENKLISSNTLKFSMNDTLFYCNNQLTGFSMLKLTDHRKIDKDVIGHYKSIYFPSLFITDERKFVSNEYAIIMLKNNFKTNKIISDFTNQFQYDLCVSTGLAPVQKNSKTPDRQADDVRYWLAASSGPLLPLSAAIPDSKTQEKIANLLRP